MADEHEVDGVNPSSFGEKIGFSKNPPGERLMDLYNNERPHRNLGMLTPAAFEQSISHGTSKPSITIYNWNNHLNSRTKIINEEQIQNLNNLTR